MTTPLDATALVPSESSAAEQSRRELQAKLNGLGGLGGRKLSAEAREKKLREACEGFESVFIQKMWQEMRNTIPKGGLMHGKEERFWQDMYDQELSKSMTSAGGIGLADMMYAQLSRNLVSASRSAAGASQSRAFAPEAAPLLEAPPADTPASETVTPPAQAASGKTPVRPAAPSQAAAAASIYDGAAPGVAAVREEGQAAPAASAPPSASAPAVNGQSAQAAAQAGGGQDGPVELNPEVERALAALRARQALHHKEEAGPAQPQASPGAPAGAQAVAGAQHKRPTASSGIELAQVARREAGDKLGSHAVRPPLHQPSPRHSADAGQGAQAAPTQAVADAEAAQGAGRARNVRFSTNMSAAERTKRGLKPIRVLNVDNVGVNSKAGAGIAAYHAANEAQAAAAGGTAPAEAPQAGQPAPLTGSAAQAAPAAGPVTGSASGPAEAAASGNFTIPPLTAADARG